LNLVALDEGGRCCRFVGGVEQGGVDARGGASEAVAGEEVVGAEAAGFGVVVQIPFDAEAVDGFEAQARDDGRDVARRGEVGDSGEVEGGVEDVATVGDEGSAEGGIDEELLGDLPTGPFAGLGFAGVF